MSLLEEQLGDEILAAGGIDSDGTLTSAVFVPDRLGDTWDFVVSKNGRKHLEFTISADSLILQQLFPLLGQPFDWSLRPR
jgi:hypothetical protein